MAYASSKAILQWSLIWENYVFLVLKQMFLFLTILTKLYKSLFAQLLLQVLEIVAHVTT